MSIKDNSALNGASNLKGFINAQQMRLREHTIAPFGKGTDCHPNCTACRDEMEAELKYIMQLAPNE